MHRTFQRDYSQMVVTLGENNNVLWHMTAIIMIEFGCGEDFITGGGGGGGGGGGLPSMNPWQD